MEVELGSHDPFHHVAVQILQFSLSFEDDPWRVKAVLFDALEQDQPAWELCEQFTKQRNLNSIDHLLETLIRAPFAALVIIDDVSDLLETVLTKRFKFPVEVLTIQRFESDGGDRLYVFEPLLRDVRTDLIGGRSDGTVRPTLNVEDIDTIVVPAREDGFKQVFLGEDAWQSVRIHGSMIPQFRYIAAYQTQPESAITHIAKVRDIVPSTEDPRKYRLLFEGPATEINRIPLVPRGRIKPLRNVRYTTHKRLEEAKTLDDVWAQPEVPA